MEVSLEKIEEIISETENTRDIGKNIFKYFCERKQMSRIDILFIRAIRYYNPDKVFNIHKKCYDECQGFEFDISYRVSLSCFILDMLKKYDLNVDIIDFLNITFRMPSETLEEQTEMLLYSLLEYVRDIPVEDLKNIGFVTPLRFRTPTEYSGLFDYGEE